MDGNKILSSTCTETISSTTMAPVSGLSGTPINCVKMSGKVNGGIVDVIEAYAIEANRQTWAARVRAQTTDVYIGRNAGYTVDSLVRWMRARVSQQQGAW